MSSVYHALHSSRRPSSLKDADYDHEILLIDHTQTATIAAATRSRSQSASDNRRDSLSPPDDESPRRHSNDQLRKKLSLREELARRRYVKPRYQDRRLGDNLISGQGTDAEPVPSILTPEDVEVIDDEGRPQTGKSSQSSKKPKLDQESTIDILYENQRGGFLCGLSLFSSGALGAADAPPWTNSAQKPSATNITNAQVPDPTWEWAWKDWMVNHTEDVDQDGWEYSFMFSKRKLKFSWHGPKWYNSFVRRRAWIRKRVKKKSGYQMQEPHTLSSDYFTIHPGITRSRSPSKAPSVQESRYSIGQLAKRDMDEEVDRADINDIEHLMKALRSSRIDRERMEAVENFIQNGGDDLVYLEDRMHEIMCQFIFQASRRLLLSHLSMTFDQALERRKQILENNQEENTTETKRIDDLEAAIRAADEQVKKLEFWSDIKGLVERGETGGAADRSQGWDEKNWVGVDESGPKDVISNRELPGAMPKNSGRENPMPDADKGKGKA